MAILKFRVYYEEDDAIYRDIVIRHTQTFLDLHQAILKAYQFETKLHATFFRSNDHWQRGREISLEKYDKEYRAAPLLMHEVFIGSEVQDPSQKFVYIYDFDKSWIFLIELIHITKEENKKISYPSIIKTEGISPRQYGANSLLGSRFLDVEEKYDLAQDAEGYGEESEESEEDVLEDDEYNKEGIEN